MQADTHPCMDTSLTGAAQATEESQISGKCLIDQQESAMLLQKMLGEYTQRKEIRQLALPF